MGTKVSAMTDSGAIQGTEFLHGIRGSADIKVAPSRFFSDSAGNVQLNFSPTASAVNYLEVNNGAATVGTTDGPGIAAKGVSSNVNLVFSTKGTAGQINFNAPFTLFSASGGPLFSLDNSDAPADGTLVGELDFTHQAQTTTWSQIQSRVTTAASNTAALEFTAGNAFGTFMKGSTANGIIIGSGSTYPGSAGNMAFATGKGIFDGASNEVLLFTQTSSAVNEMRIANAATGNGPTLSATGGDTDISINLTPKGAGGVRTGGYVKTLSTTVASLPTAATAGSGARAFVTDATATTFLSTVAGSGANKVPVVSDGTNWLIG